MRVFHLLCCVLAAAAATGAATAAAQTGAAPTGAAPTTAPVPSDGGTGWRVECANDGKTLDCQTVNKVTQRESQQLVAAVAVRIPPDTKKPVLMMQLPLGIQVTEPVTVQIDEGKTERYPIQTCAQNGCFLAAPVSDAVIGALRGGKNVKVAFQSVAKQTVTVTMPLGGFALAYDRIK
jgi:invasion protein IalB